jgi:hypothetical protein
MFCRLFLRLGLIVRIGASSHQVYTCDMFEFQPFSSWLERIECADFGQREDCYGH